MNTIDKLSKEMPEIKDDELVIIDREIKGFVVSVDEDIFSQTVEYKKRDCKNIIDMGMITF